MKWFWAREPRQHPEAEAAVEQSTKDLEDAKARWPEVHDVAANMRDLRRRNYFAEQFRLTLRSLR